MKGRYGNLKRMLAAAAAAAALEASAGTYTDLWWNPGEAGWGVNVVQQLETAFVTLFVYGEDGRPTWFVASDARVTAYSEPGGYPVFSGTLYRAEGPYHGGPFDPSRVRLQAVGTLQLEVLERNRMRVHYTAGGATVVREVARQTWQEQSIAANYVAQFALRVAGPQGQPVGGRDFGADVIVHMHEPEGYMRLDLHDGGRCEFRGPHEQNGKLIRFTGAFTCTTGDARAGSFELRDLEVTDNGITGYLRTWSQGITQYGRVGAVRR